MLDDELPAPTYASGALTEGERWTAAALAELRRGGFRSAAWRRFIARSLERADQTRRTRPQLARQARVWGVCGAAAWIAACKLAGRAGDISPSRTGGLLWWISVWKMLDWHLGMAEGEDGAARVRLSAADAATLVRFWLVPLLPPARASTCGLPALIVLGGVTDWLDGDLARGRGRSRLGRDLDTTADLAFFATAAASARAAGRESAPAAWAAAARSLAGTLLELAVVFGSARRAAFAARPWGAALRVGGLALGAPGLRRIGSAALIAGCVVPPRST